MPIIHKTDLAERDLFEVVLKIALRNETAAYRLFALVNERYALLAQFPEMGRERPDIAPDVRLCPIIKDYVILYRSIPGGVSIARFLDGRRDLHALR
jgi:toxin ParE1/3/4